MRTMRPVTRLRVVRTLSDGQKIAAGELARNARGEIFFAWSDDYLDSGLGNLSPFKFPGERGLIRGPAAPWDGLHGVFADSLPDGWGLLLQDRCLRARGIDPRTAGPLDRLAMTGKAGGGSHPPGLPNSGPQQLRKARPGPALPRACFQAPRPPARRCALSASQGAPLRR